jgi:NitT/TauT family transport system substrate-binding protein
MRIRRVVLVLLLILFFVGQYFSTVGDQGRQLLYGNSPGVPTLQLYAAATATTPQLPLWSAYRRGKLRGVCNLEVSLWNNAEMLKGLLLAGKGDLWVGHVEGFALAKRQGADIALFIVSAWKKFFFLTTNSDVNVIEDLAGKPLAYTPPGSPAIPIYKALFPDARLRSVPLVPLETKQAGMRMLSGSLESVLAPEPLVSILLKRVPGLKVVGALEDVYGKRFNREARMPLAGLAINLKTAREYPELFKRLQKILVEEQEWLKAHQASIPSLLPEDFTKHLPDGVLEESLKRDLLYVADAAQAESEIVDYFRIVVPSLVTGGKLGLDSSFIWDGNAVE